MTKPLPFRKSTQAEISRRKECKMERSYKTNEPWILQRADPYVYRHTDGSYYFTASLPEYDGIALRRSATLGGLAEAEEVRIWNAHKKGIMSFHIWAPELHYLDGKWYIYFAGGDVDDIWAIRPYVLDCKDADPISGSWTEMGMIDLTPKDCENGKIYDDGSIVLDGMWNGFSIECDSSREAFEDLIGRLWDAGYRGIPVGNGVIVEADSVLL